ncbi:MAG TPA: response regulator [Bryobacteraceae bacterium]|nr:response regulator [Bryobacteraceae bacterium]
MTIVEQNAARSLAAAAPLRISIVDDDASIREALKSLMRSVRWEAEAFASAEEFLASLNFEDTACLILDVRLPGMSGFELQDRLNARDRAIPIVFISGHADETSRQRALAAGAVDLLSKPVRREVLFQAIHAALQRLTE